ncbi:hypothetical protein [Lysinibacter cavernae]|uniref:hypothetical protein n=1 Tax=Lysinibacter cavernae TaxID=1640652 RepID=UPI003620A635
MRQLLSSLEKLNPDERERAATRFIRKLAQSDDAEESIRRQIYFALIAPGLSIIDDVIGHSMTNPSVLRESVAVKLEELLETRVMRTDGSGLDLNKVLLYSPIGWAKKLLAMSLDRITQRERMAYRKFNDQVDLLTIPDTISEISFTDSTDEFDGDLESSGLAGTRGTQRLRLGAQLLHTQLNIPQIARPELKGDRSRLLRVLREHEDVVLESLDTYHAIASGRPVWNDRDTDDDLLRLWSEFSLLDAERLLNRNPLVIVSIVEAALLQRSRPSRRDVAATKRLVKAASSQPGWSELAGSLVDAWLAEHFAPTNDFNTRSDQETAVEESNKLSKEWPRLVEAAANWPGQPIVVAGADATVVDKWLTSVLFGVQ